MKLTAKNLHTLPLPEGKKEHVYSDEDVPGFLLRIRAGGARRLIFQYKIGGASKKITLGAVNGLNFAETRTTAERLYARVRLGEDPGADKAKAKLKAAETFAAVAKQFLEYQRSQLRPRSYAAVERHLLTYSKILHNTPLADVARRDVAAVIAAVAESSSPTTGNRARASLSSLFAWAIASGLTESNPVTGTLRAEETPRDRVLSPPEIKLIWDSLGDDHYGSILKLLLLTGQRASEIADLRWNEIVDGKILLPGTRTKNGRAHVIPLSEPARAILEAQLHRAGRDLIFGLGQGGFSGWHIAKQELDQRIAEAAGKPLPAWVHHDLRRSTATHMAELGIQPHVIECVLNHVSGFRAGVSGIYNRNSYLREMTIALDLWADRLLAIVSGRVSNVVPLRG